MENDNTYKIVLYALLVVGGLAAFLFSRNKLRDCYLLFVCTLALGYRTYEVTKALRIIPAELILYVLPFLVLGTKSRKDGPKHSLPIWLLAWLPFWGLTWLAGWGGGFAWDHRLAEFRNFVFLVPLFLVTPIVLSSRGGWQSARVPVRCKHLDCGDGAAGLFPGIAKALPGFMGNSDPIVNEGFKRASFSFYGSPIAVFICVVVLPFSLTAWDLWPSPTPRWR